MDFDASLSLEDDYYQQGYAEGSKVGNEQGLIEGRIYGTEQAFERYVKAGIIKGRLSAWHKIFIDDDRIQSSIEKLQQLLRSLPLQNDERADGMDYDHIMLQVNSKMKVLASLCGDETIRDDFPRIVPAAKDLDDKAFAGKLANNNDACG